jgi:3-oxoacyl-[acyl-carrier-protein] synthase-1
MPPHIWDGEYDPALPRLNFASPHSRFANRDQIAALSNSFAFGGSNAVLVLGRGW